MMKEWLRSVKKRFKKKTTVSQQDYQRGLDALGCIKLDLPLGSFTKKIWMYWDSGLDSAPEVVKLSYKSWVQLNPDYEVIFLDKTNIKQHLGFEFNDVYNCFTVDLKAAGKSDFLRAYLLYRYGGVWADATTFCMKPLDTWLNMSETEFFSFREKYSDDRQLVSWFLASYQGSRVLSDLLKKSIDYLYKPERKINLEIRGLKATRRLANKTGFISQNGSGYPLLNHLECQYTTPYFWMFYLFNETVKNNSLIEGWGYVQTLTNNYAELDDDFSIFSHSYVAKQTYRDKYVVTEQYKNRVQFLMNNVLIKK
ncbi:capsular polysaccharide synthesis protein [Photobacterium minamisatsumaniensis]|uniref:capsular polysaccharide synthesis protein n=1 Tax=Photobacterium minamisatsumaniensis TaxID=2910233 RepID=UPI003D0CBA4F